MRGKCPISENTNGWKPAGFQPGEMWQRRTLYELGGRNVVGVQCKKSRSINRGSGFSSFGLVRGLGGEKPGYENYASPPAKTARDATKVIRAGGRLKAGGLALTLRKTRLSISND